MRTLLQKFGSMVKGVLTGFDRIVFKGSILPLMHEAGVASFLAAKRILNKDSWPASSAVLDTLAKRMGNGSYLRVTARVAAYR